MDNLVLKDHLALKGRKAPEASQDYLALLELQVLKVRLDLEVHLGHLDGRVHQDKVETLDHLEGLVQQDTLGTLE